MGSTREEVESLESDEVIFLEKGNEVAGLSGGVTGEIDDSGREDVEETLNEVGVATSARWIEDDGGVWCDEIESGFGFSEVGGDVGRSRGSEVSGFWG